LPDPVSALKEWNRVVRPDGLISIVLPCDPGLAWRAGRSFGPRRNATKLGIEYDYLEAAEHVSGEPDPQGGQVEYMNDFTARMRIRQCPWCGNKVSEADRLWDQVVASGQCPSCNRFYDREREAEALRDVAARTREPGFASELRHARVRALGEALVTMFVALVIAAVAVVAHLHVLLGPAGAFMLVAVGRLVWAFVVNPERHVRGTVVGKITAASDADQARVKAAKGDEPPQQRT
jgi:hypothetical protein